MSEQGDGFESDVEPLERHPVVSREAQCQECDGDLHQIGSFFACQEPACSRYAVPVNQFGNTDAEQEADDEAQGQAAVERDASGPTYAERHAYETEQFRRGGL